MTLTPLEIAVRITDQWGRNERKLLVRLGYLHELIAHELSEVLDRAFEEAAVIAEPHQYTDAHGGSIAEWIRALKSGGSK